MKREHIVRTVMLDWSEQTLEITDTSGNKHTVQADTPIHVTMVGYPDREEKDMPARDLKLYIVKGYIIEQISYEEE